LTSLEEVRRRAESDAKTYGYFLNPDSKLLKNILEGLNRNEERYGYPSCPCRFASGKLELDRDIICPCDYRDQDVAEYGSCYCTLYVRKDVYEGKTPLQQVPERRPQEKIAMSYSSRLKTAAEKPVEARTITTKEPLKIKMKLWYCKQCGYVCLREDPPYICPVCKAKREMFAEVRIITDMQA